MNSSKKNTAAESLKQVEYEVPLSETELLDLGCVTAILSQIDNLLTETLSSVSNTPAWATYIFSEKATMSAKIGMFEKLLSGLNDAEVKTKGKNLIKELYKINDDRNLLFHGMWAFHFDPKTKKGWPACIWQNKKPIRPSDLPEIAVRSAAVSRQLGDFLGVVNPSFRDPPWSTPRRFFVATENVDMAKIQDAVLTRISK